MRPSPFAGLGGEKKDKIVIFCSYLELFFFAVLGIWPMFIYFIYLIINILGSRKIAGGWNKLQFDHWSRENIKR